MTSGSSKEGTDYVDLILRTYQEEMAGLTSDVMEQQNPIAQIQFMTDVQVQAEKSKEMCIRDRCSRCCSRILISRCADHHLHRIPGSVINDPEPL